MIVSIVSCSSTVSSDTEQRCALPGSSEFRSVQKRMRQQPHPFLAAYSMVPSRVDYSSVVLTATWGMHLIIKTGLMAFCPFFLPRLRAVIRTCGVASTEAPTMTRNVSKQYFLQYSLGHEGCALDSVSLQDARLSLWSSSQLYLKGTSPCLDKSSWKCTSE